MSLLCVKDLHVQFHEREQEEETTSQYIIRVLTDYYKNKENGGKIMTGGRTMAFQIPEELFQRIKAHLARESARTGRKLTQRDFVLGLVERALDEAEAQAGEGGQPQADAPATEA